MRFASTLSVFLCLAFLQLAMSQTAQQYALSSLISLQTAVKINFPANSNLQNTLSNLILAIQAIVDPGRVL
jgi:hypothetical protein